MSDETIERQVQFLSDVAIPAGVTIAAIRQHAEADETYPLTPREGLVLMKFLRVLASKEGHAS